MSHEAFRLLQKHQRLDEHLRLEQGRRWPDLVRIRQLKKLKLAVKDALMKLGRGKVLKRT